MALIRSEAFRTSMISIPQEYSTNSSLKPTRFKSFFRRGISVLASLSMITMTKTVTTSQMLSINSSESHYSRVSLSQTPHLEPRNTRQKVPITPTLYPSKVVSKTDFR